MKIKSVIPLEHCFWFLVVSEIYAFAVTNYHKLTTNYSVTGIFNVNIANDTSNNASKNHVGLKKDQCDLIGSLVLTVFYLLFFTTFLLFVIFMLCDRNLRENRDFLININLLTTIL